MNQSKKLTVRMTRGEIFAGWVFVAFYLILSSVVLEFVFGLLGVDVGTLAGRTQMNAVFFAVNFLLTLVIFHRYLMGNLVMAFRRFWGFIQAAILGFAMYYALTTAVNLVVTFLVPGIVNLNDQQIFAMAQQNRAVMLVGTIALAPITEECIFRGLIFQNVYRKNRVLAYAVSTLLFSAIHVVGYIDGHNSWQVLLGCTAEYLPAGIALGWAYERADSVWAPVLIHCAINAVGMGLMV